MKSSLVMLIDAHLPKRARNPVGERARLLSSLLRRTLDLLAVLVRARQKEHIVAEQPAGPRDGVRDHRRVRVSDVRLRVDVVDRGGDVERTAHGRSRKAFIAIAWTSLIGFPSRSAMRSTSSNS